MVARWAVCWLCWVLFAASVLGAPTLHSLSYYETLDYDPLILKDQHLRVTRETGFSNGVVHLHLTAFNRSFVSVLSHDKARAVFGTGVKFYFGGVETSEYDPRSFYGGHLEGEPGSLVRGHIIDGVFDGVIHSAMGSYHIEQTHKFFAGPQDFHSIIYQHSDVRVPETSCEGEKGKLLDKLSKISSEAVPLHDDYEVLHGADDHIRLKRQLFVDNRRFCRVRVAADHLFFEALGGGSVVNTMSQIVSVISGVQRIYANTDFTGDGNSDNVQPVIVKLEVLDQNMRGYRYGAASIAVDDFLDLWSQEDQTEFCLALLLTYRDFANGVLGLAWVAQPAGGNRGGICEGRVRLRTGERSLNTGIVTYLNFGQTQPRSVATITIAHEFGHNFGSPHDPGSCSPGGSQGNFIMFPQATDGALPNNDDFSSCSIGSILPVLQTKSGCFSDSVSFCGNGVRELGESCDCGNEESCSQDICCTTSCNFTTNAHCSASDPCCDDMCQLRNTSHMCSSQTECGEASFCNGNSGECPAPRPRRESFLCNMGRNACVNGMCAGSICVNRNTTDCQCTAANGNPPTNFCHVCCQVGTTCNSSFDLFGQSNGQLREGGRSCNNFQGYCSSETPPTCIVVDNERTLEDLLDIFNINTLTTVTDWLQQYWYVPVAVIAVIAVLIFLLQITYRKRKPLKNSINRVRNSTLRRQHTNVAPPSQQQAAQRRRPRQNREISQGEGEQRLRRFFPTAERDTLLSVMRSTRSESKAVKKMLDLGYPLYKVPLPRS